MGCPGFSEMVTAREVVSAWALPKYRSNSSSELIRLGSKSKENPLASSAISVYPMNTGMAVSTWAMEGGSFWISSM